MTTAAEFDYRYFGERLELLEEWADKVPGRTFSIIRFSVVDNTRHRRGWALHVCEGAETLYSNEGESLTGLAEHIVLFLAQQGGFDG